MTIPEHRGLKQPAWRASAPQRSEDAEAEVAEPPDNTVSGNRLHWAMAYLDRRNRDWAGEAGATDTAASPEALIASNVRLLQERLKRDLLDRIHGESPHFFERLIIELLLAMGYGCRRDLARHLGRCGDGGMDGAVPQDILGFDVIYIQAKRYRMGVQVPVSAVREFAGSLDAHKARKGVFVTTAAFPRSAATFVSAVPSKIVLIDGKVLADLLISYNIGVKVRETYEIKEIDETCLTPALRRPG